MKSLRITILILLSSLTSICVFGLYLMFSTSGSRLALSLINEFTSYQIQFTELKGNLVEGMAFNELEIKSDDFVLHAHEFAIGYDFRAILKQDYGLKFLKAEKLVVKLSSDENAAKIDWQTITLNEANLLLQSIFPVAVQVDDIVIDHALILSQDFTHEIEHLTIKNASNSLDTLKEIHYLGSLGKIDAEIDNTLNVQWQIHLEHHPALTALGCGRIQSTGKIVMATEAVQDPRNHLDASFNFDSVRFDKHHVQNLELKIKGSFKTHLLQAQGQYQAQPFSMQMQGQASLKHWQGEVKQLAFQLMKQPIQTRGKLDLNWQDSQLKVNSAIQVNHILPLKVTLGIDKSKPHALTGAVQANISDLRQLGGYFPNLAHVKGSLNTDLKLSGTLLAPQWHGLFELKDAKVKAPNLNKSAYINALTISLNQNKAVIDGYGTWGQGQFKLNGEGLLQQDLELKLNLKGDRLLLSDSPEYYIVGSPDLTLTIKNRRPLIVGQIKVNEADIRSLKQNTKQTSDDVVIVSSKHKIKTAQVQSIAKMPLIDTRIDIVLGDKITYKGYGVTTKVDGQLTITQEQGAGPFAKGRLVFRDGTYKAYGKTFTIREGQILFTGGPIYDPILQIRAERLIQKHNRLASFSTTQPITCGVEFSGHLKTPKLSFYSNPTLSDADIMSYLVVGRPQSQMNEAQAELLYEAVTQLTRMMGHKRDDVQFDLAEQLSLTQMGFAKRSEDNIKPGSTTAASRNPLEDTVLVLGKQLSDKLYLQYSVGLLDSASTFGIRYALGKNVTIEAATGTQGSSADVLLSFEGH